MKVEVFGSFRQIFCVKKLEIAKSRDQSWTGRQKGCFSPGTKACDDGYVMEGLSTVSGTRSLVTSKCLYCLDPEPSVQVRAFIGWVITDGLFQYHFRFRGWTVQKRAFDFSQNVNKTPSGNFK